MTIFLAGIMQGSRREESMHDQDYRKRLKQLLEDHLGGAEVYCPLEIHPGSFGYTDAKGRDVFLHHNRMAGECDVLVAYLPEASMGTAVEMWEAYRAGRVVLTISPLAKNWAVKYLSDHLYATIDAFEQAVRRGQVADVIAGKQPLG